MFDRKNSWRVVLAAIAVLLVLCSCNPAPKYARPPVNAPQAFKESAPPQFKEGTGWKVAQPGDDKIRGNWWEMYNDPVLNSLEQQVQISNQTVIQSEANYRSARSLGVAARSSLLRRLCSRIWRVSIFSPSTSRSTTPTRASNSSRVTALIDLASMCGCKSSTTRDAPKQLFPHGSMR